MGTLTIGIDAIRDLMADLATYNRQHSVPAGLMSMLALEPVAGPASADVLQLNQALLQLKHRDLLNQVGLSLEPVATGNKVFGSSQEIASSRMHLNVSCGRSLITFMAGLERPEDETWELYSKVIRELAHILLQQLQRYDLRQPGDETLELFGVLEQFIIQHERLIYRSETTDELLTLLTIARQGYLAEYLETRWLFQSGFGHSSSMGPSIWHRDSSPDSFSGDGSWGGAVKKVAAMGENPKAHTYQRMLAQRLLLDVQYARQDMLDHQNESWLADNVASYRQTLDWVEFELNGI